MPEYPSVLAAIAWLQALSPYSIAATAVVLALAAGALILAAARGNWRFRLRPTMGACLVLGAAWMAYGMLAAAQVEADAIAPHRAISQQPPRASEKPQMASAGLVVELPPR